MSLCNINWKELLSGDTHPKPDVQFIVVGDDGQRVFAAHRYLLAIVSPVFKEQFYKNDMENVGIVKITLDTSPSAAQAFFRYIYEKILVNVSFHDWFELLKLSERYQMVKLMMDVKEGIIKFINDNSEEAVGEIKKMNNHKITKDDKVVNDLKEKLSKSEEAKKTLKKNCRDLRKTLEEKNEELGEVLARETLLEQVEEKLKQNNEELLKDQRLLIKKKENLVKANQALLVQNTKTTKEKEILNQSTKTSMSMKCDKLAQENAQLLAKMAEKEERAKKVLSNAKTKIQNLNFENKELQRKLAAKGGGEFRSQFSQTLEIDGIQYPWYSVSKPTKTAKENTANRDLHNLLGPALFSSIPTNTQVVLQQAWTAHTADLRTQLEKLQDELEKLKVGNEQMMFQFEKNENLNKKVASEEIKEKEKLTEEVFELKQLVNGLQQELGRRMEENAKIKEISSDNASTTSDSSSSIKTELLEVKKENILEIKEESNLLSWKRTPRPSWAISAIEYRKMREKEEALELEIKTLKARVSTAAENFKKALCASNSKYKSLADEKKQLQEEMESMKSAFRTQIEFLKKEPKKSAFRTLKKEHFELELEHNKVLLQLSNSTEKASASTTTPPPPNVILPSPIVTLPQLHTLPLTTSTPPAHINPTLIQGPSRDKLEDPVAAFEAAMEKLDREKSKGLAEALTLDIKKKQAAIDKQWNEQYLQREAEKAKLTLGNGLLSRSKRENFLAAGNEQLEREQAEREREIDGKNPWGSIAENWSRDGREEKRDGVDGCGGCRGLGGHRFNCPLFLTCSENRKARSSLSPQRQSVESSVIACLSFDLSDEDSFEETQDLRMSLDQRKIEDEESGDLRMSLDQRKIEDEESDDLRMSLNQRRNEDEESSYPRPRMSLDKRMKRKVVVDTHEKDIMGEDRSQTSCHHEEDLDKAASNNKKNNYFDVAAFNKVKEFTSPRKRLSPYRRKKSADGSDINVSIYEEEDSEGGEELEEGEYVESEVVKEEVEDVKMIHVTVPNHQNDDDVPSPDRAKGNKKRRRVERKKSSQVGKKIKSNEHTETNQREIKDASNDNSEKKKEISLDSLVIRSNAYGSKGKEAKN